MISPRAVALQGFGRGARFRAVQGLVPVFAFASGGGVRVRVPRGLSERWAEVLIADDEFLLLIAQRLIAEGVIH